MQNFRADNENLLTVRDGGRWPAPPPVLPFRAVREFEKNPVAARGLPVYGRMHLRYTEIIIVLTLPVNAPDHRAL